jgi:hypothetical protein
MNSVPQPSIYVCNWFTLVGGQNTAFFAGKEQLLRSSAPRAKLLAACGERSIKLGQDLPEPALKGMHVWELDSWPALYELMYEFCEAKWYRAMGDTLASENQHLLVNLTSGYGIAARSAWRSDSSPGYRYLSEELTLKRGATMHAYLRDLNWFAAELSRFGVVRTWCARHITGLPGRICLLWQVPDHTDIEEALSSVAAGAKSGARYAAMMRGIAELRRELLQPMYSERLDERIRAGEPAPIVQAGGAPERSPTADLATTQQLSQLQ